MNKQNQKFHILYIGNNTLHLYESHGWKRVECDSSYFIFQRILDGIVKEQIEGSLDAVTIHTKEER